MVYPGLTPLDLFGPLQVLSGLEVVEAMFGVQPRHHVVVVAESLDAVPTDTPALIAATSTLDEVPEPDIIVVPGGGAATAGIDTALQLAAKLTSDDLARAVQQAAKTDGNRGARST